MPFMRGSWMSMRIRAGGVAWASAMPSSALSASAVRYPWNWRMSRSSFRFFSLSSTIRISSPAMVAPEQRR